MTATSLNDRRELRLKASAWCIRLSEGGLLPDEQVAFEAWLEGDPENRTAFDDAVRVWRGMEETSLSSELIDLRRAALDSFQRTSRAKWKRGFSLRRHPIAAVAACLVLIVSAGGLWWHYSPDVYRTGVGERRVFALSDGSKISLDATTALEVRYLGGRRELRLEQGRAKFDVAKDPLRPFSVAAADKVVVATGTAFSVELVGRQVSVVLYEGHVSVLTKGSNQSSPQPVQLYRHSSPADQVLTPGHELVAAISDSVARVAPADVGRTLSWEQGQLVFVDEPLASAVERVNRYAGEKLGIGDEAAGRVLINGVYNAEDTAAFVEGVTGVAPIVLEDVGGQKVFVSRKR